MCGTECYISNVFNVIDEHFPTLPESNQNGTLESIELSGILGELDPYKALDPNDISTYVLKECAETLDGQLEKFTKLLDDGSVRRKWKRAKVVLVF